MLNIKKHSLLLPITALKLVQALLALEKPISLRELSKFAEVPLSKCSVYSRALENLGYIRRRPKISVADRGLVYILSYCYPLRAIPFIGFESLERPAATIQKISEIGKTKNLKYVFTHLAASEIISPYKFSNLVYFYADRKDIEGWKKALREAGIIESAQGAIRLLVSDLNSFLGSREINDVFVVSPALLYSDLYSAGEIETARWTAKKEVLLNYGNI